MFDSRHRVVDVGVPVPAIAIRSGGSRKLGVTGGVFWGWNFMMVGSWVRPTIRAARADRIVGLVNSQGPLSIAERRLRRGEPLRLLTHDATSARRDRSTL